MNSRFGTIFCCTIILFITACAASLNKAIQIGDLNSVKSIVEKDSRVLHTGTADSQYPLHQALSEGQMEIAKFLLVKGADPNLKDDSKRTPLHIATNVGNFEMVQYLVENGADIDASSLFPAIRRKVMLDADQIPEYSDIRKAGHDGGDFIFLRRR